MEFDNNHTQEKERAKHSFSALPDPLSCFVMSKLCLNQEMRFRRDHSQQIS